MPSLATHQESNSIKMLLIGDSGTGKTGALASLVEAGYKLNILDFDNGLDILVNALKAKPNAKELLAKVNYETCIDKMKAVSGNMVADGMPNAFSKAMNLLTNWKTPTEDLGPVSNWNKDTILVIDSLTFMSHAAFRLSEVMINSKDPRQHYGDSQKRIENCLGLLYSPVIKCHVIIISHITFIEVDTGITKGYPTSIGKALSPQIPRYFNTVLQCRLKGSGETARRVIGSVPTGLIDLKTPLLPGKLPSELPIETGLADFFKVLSA